MTVEVSAKIGVDLINLRLQLRFDLLLFRFLSTEILLYHNMLIQHGVIRNNRSSEKSRFERSINEKGGTRELFFIKQVWGFYVPHNFVH